MSFPNPAPLPCYKTINSFGQERASLCASPGKKARRVFCTLAETHALVEKSREGFNRLGIRCSAGGTMTQDV